VSAETVQSLGPNRGHQFFTKVLSRSLEAQLLHERLRAEGLEPQPQRTQVFNLFSDMSLQSIAVGVTPYSDPDQQREGGMSSSQGGHAQAVIVKLADRSRITGFTHLAVLDGQVTASEHDVGEVLGGPGMLDSAEDDAFVEAVALQTGKVRAALPLVEIDTRQVRSLASISFSKLLDDDFSRSVHDESEIRDLRGNARAVNAIGAFVLFRTQGSACCSCSCSCWGSSSCSCSYVG